MRSIRATTSSSSASRARRLSDEEVNSIVEAILSELIEGRPVEVVATRFALPVAAILWFRDAAFAPTATEPCVEPRRRNGGCRVR